MSVCTGVSMGVEEGESLEQAFARVKRFCDQNFPPDTPYIMRYVFGANNVSADCVSDPRLSWFRTPPA